MALMTASKGTKILDIMLVKYACTGKTIDTI
jgi:hypothetical protein